MDPIPWIGRAWRLAVLLAVAAAGWWEHGRWHAAELAQLRTEVAQARAKHAADRAAWADGARQASEAFRAEEIRRTAAHQEIVDAATTAKARAQRDAAAARAALGSLRDTAGAAAARACPATGDPAAAGSGPPAEPAALVLADVLSSAADRAVELAAAADAAHAAGSACERAYQALIPASAPLLSDLSTQP
jgi:hypothetical protein